MAQEEHHASSDLERLNEKSKQGVLNVVGDVLNDPKVQDLIKKSVMRETVSSGLMMACFLVGLMMLFNAAKAAMSFDWRGDLTVSLILISIGSCYILKSFKPKNRKKNNATVPDTRH